MKYTMGKWHYNKALARIFARIEKPTKHEFLAEVAIISNDNTQEAEANAHLISAAPDMYVALTGVLTDLDSIDTLCATAHVHPYIRMRQDAERVLLKAKGK